MSVSPTELAQRIIKRNDGLKSAAATWLTFWQDVGNYVMPRKAEITSTVNQPSTDKTSRLFDTTAVRANMVLANGQLAWMTPMESKWFSFDPPAATKMHDKARAWYSSCTDIAARELALSNFYSEIHEFYLDRGAFGTAAILCEPGKRNALYFRRFDVGTFTLCEDDEGYVDTLFREFKLTARQAAKMFGEDNLPESMLSDLADVGNPNKADTEYEIIHAIYPREDSERDLTKRDGVNKAVASCYVEKKSRHVLKQSGYDEQPFFASRFLKWGNFAYGWSPSWMALPDARQLNFLEMQMDALAELAAFPRLLFPDTHEGEIDLRASGITYFDPANPNAIPKEWATQGRYDIGFQRAEQKRKAIEDAFHVDLFKMFAMIEKQMTAREVAERSAEKLIQFSPTFARMTTELFNPLLRRVFGVLARQGKFPPPPQEALVLGEGGPTIPEPEVSYMSRIALAIKALENNSFLRSIEMFSPLVEVRPDILDNYDMDKIVRGSARNDGLPDEWIADEEAVAEIRQARAEAAQQAAQAEQAERMASAAAKAGSIPPESPVAQMMGGGQ